MLSKLESFKVGFLNRCVEDGLSTEEALSCVKEASDCLDSLEKQAGTFGDLVGSGTDITKYLGNKALLAGLIAPPVLGGLAGYSHAKLTDVDDDDVDDYKKQELIDEFRRQSEKLRHSQALMAYKDRRKKRSNVYM